MLNEQELPNELAALERQLARLTPAAPRIDRDRLMFAAGRASADQDHRAVQLAEPSWFGERFWPVATAAMTAATVVLATMLLLRSQPSPNEPPTISVVEQTPAAVASVDVVAALGSESALPNGWLMRTWALPPTTGYLAIRHAALSYGVGALDRREPSSVSVETSVGSGIAPAPATARELMREFLPETPPSKGA